MQDLLFDPQTSGGLLFAVPEGEAENFAAGCPREHIGGGDRKSGERQDVCLLVE